MISDGTAKKLRQRGYHLEGGSTCGRLFGLEKWRKGGNVVVIHSGRAKNAKQMISIYNETYVNVLLQAEDLIAIVERLKGLREEDVPLQQNN